MESVKVDVEYWYVYPDAHHQLNGNKMFRCVNKFSAASAILKVDATNCRKCCSNSAQALK